MTSAASLPSAGANRLRRPGRRPGQIVQIVVRRNSLADSLLSRAAQRASRPRLCELLDESQPAVSHHLALLRVAGLIERRREGKHNFYGLKTRQFSTLLDMLFAAMPEGNRRIRLDDYMLTHNPA